MEGIEVTAEMDGPDYTGKVHVEWWSYGDLLARLVLDQEQAGQLGGKLLDAVHLIEVNEDPP